MEPNRRRRFRIVDGIVLVAAVGVGLAWMRLFTKSHGYPDQPFEGWRLSALELRLQIQCWWAGASYNLLAAFTIAVFLLRILPPRPGRRILTRQPGAVACGAVIAALAVEKIPNLLALVSVIYSGEPWWWVPWTVEGPFEGLAVFIAWLLLLGSGRWKHEKSWIDDVGQILGIFWIVLPPFLWVFETIVIEYVHRM